MNLRQPGISRSSVGSWIALFAAFLAVSAAITGSYTYVFATKGELKEVELKQANTADQKLNEWRLKTLEIQVDNLEMRMQRMDRNIVTLLERFRLEPDPVPPYKPLPKKPQGGTP